MEIRRALLLFAIVLGLAAIATSITQPRSGGDQTDTATAPARVAPSVTPRPSPKPPVALRFDLGDEQPDTQKLPAGRAATVTVRVGEPGQVSLDGLGLTQSADQLTPARFDVLVDRPGRHRVSFTPAGSDEAQMLGELNIEG